MNGIIEINSDTSFRAWVLGMARYLTASKGLLGRAPLPQGLRDSSSGTTAADDNDKISSLLKEVKSG